MDKISSFDRTTVKFLRDQIDKKLAEIGQQFDIIISTGNASFTSHSIRFKVECGIKTAELNQLNEMLPIGGNAPIVSRPSEVEDFKRYAFQHRLPVDSIGKLAIVGGKRYRIVGYKANNHKMPIIACRESDGRRFKFSIPSIQMALGI